MKCLITQSMKSDSMYLRTLECEPIAGSCLVDCSYDAILLAVKHNVDVEFIFNRKPYKVKYRDLFDCVKEI